MLPSNKQISQSHAGKFEITLKRGFGEKGGGGARKGVRGGGGGLHPQACLTEE